MEFGWRANRELTVTRHLVETGLGCESVVWLARAPGNAAKRSHKLASQGGPPSPGSPTLTSLGRRRCKEKHKRTGNAMAMETGDYYILEISACPRQPRPVLDGEPSPPPPTVRHRLLSSQTGLGWRARNLVGNNAQSRTCHSDWSGSASALFGGECTLKGMGRRARPVWVGECALVGEAPHCNDLVTQTQCTASLHAHMFETLSPPPHATKSFQWL